MVTTFLDKLGEIFDRRSLVAYWTPVFVWVVLTFALLVARLGPARALGWWTELDGLQQLWSSLGGLLLITILAFVLQAFTSSVLRLYQGLTIPKFARFAWLHGQRRTWQTLHAEIDLARKAVVEKAKSDILKEGKYADDQSC